MHWVLVLAMIGSPQINGQPSYYRIAEAPSKEFCERLQKDIGGRYANDARLKKLDTKFEFFCVDLKDQ